MRCNQPLSGSHFSCAIREILARNHRLKSNFGWLADLSCYNSIAGSHCLLEITLQMAHMNSSTSVMQWLAYFHVQPFLKWLANFFCCKGITWLALALGFRYHPYYGFAFLVRKQLTNGIIFALIFALK